VVATESVPDQAPDGFVGAVMVWADTEKVAVTVTLEAASQFVSPA
jgi:hypothetical protein